MAAPAARMELNDRGSTSNMSSSCITTYIMTADNVDAAESVAVRPGAPKGKPKTE
jgi:hypothetical protein